MKIYIRNLEGRTTEIIVKGSDTIGRGKEIYKTYTKGVTDIPQWKFNGMVLKNNLTFDYYEFEAEDNIISNDRSEGGKNK
jgi:hypothetical protein